MQAGQACCSNLLIVDGDACCTGDSDTFGYISASQTCCNGAVTSWPNQACCGQTGYDNSTNICCSGHFMVAGNACCQNIATGIVNGYNSSVHTCCNGFVDTTGVYSACCGGSGYNTAIAVCCQSDNLIHPGDSCCVGANGTTQGYNKTSSTCCNGAIVTGKSGFCCGLSLYNSSYQVCCSNSPQTGDSCCGSVGFYKSNATCCNGTLTAAANLSCCGSVGFDRTQMVCCDQTRPTYGDYCCPLAAGGYQGFYTLEQSCCNGVVVSGGFSVNPQCYYNFYCAKIFYNPAISACCNNTIYNKNTDACCGSQVYNKNTDACCGSQVYNKNAFACCGSQVYNMTLSICCPDTQVYNGDSCCQRNDGSYLGYRNGSNCCGNYAYNGCVTKSDVLSATGEGSGGLVFSMNLDNKFSGFMADALSNMGPLDMLELRGLSSVSLLDLSAFQITGTLFLTYGHIATLPSNFLAGQVSIQGVMLNNNQISSLPDDFFKGLVNLQSIDLSNNLIANLQPNLFNLTSNQIGNLYLVGNPLQSLPPNIFKDLTSIVNLLLPTSLSGKVNSSYLGLRDSFTIQYM
jgi:hypothetical protein